MAMKIISTSDWHIGNLFHGSDRLPEHKHFLGWLLGQLKEQRPDALLVAGDVFDNGNPSAAAQAVYYEFLADATQACPGLQIIITAGNHDSASRIEAPRPLLSRHKVEIRGTVRRIWQDGKWINDYDDLIIPVENSEGEKIVVIAVPYLRSDVMHNTNYSQGVNDFLREITLRAREKHSGCKILMMTHMYAKGADIAQHDASEKIVVGGQEEVNMEGWNDHPDYMTCGHIHKRQQVWNTDWARYTGSILPMSFAEIDYTHGVDLITVDQNGAFNVEQRVYKPQHKLRVLPENDEELTGKQLMKLIDKELRDRGADGKLTDSFDYVVLKVKLEKVDNDLIKGLEEKVKSKDAVLCKIQKIMPTLQLTTIIGNQQLTSIDDILDRDPLETLQEAFAIKHKGDMNERQCAMLKELISGIRNEINL